MCWIWLQDDPKIGEPCVVGYMAGHVDDFNRAGDNASATWGTAKAKIDGLYLWGTIKKGEYRYMLAVIFRKNLMLKVNTLRSIKIFT